jgi:hypothetical protein
VFASPFPYVASAICMPLRAGASNAPLQAICAHILLIVPVAYQHTALKTKSGAPPRAVTAARTHSRAQNFFFTRHPKTCASFISVRTPSRS